MNARDNKNPLDWVYDLECYPNVFTASFKHVNTGHRMKFEISVWKNDLQPLIVFLWALKQANCRLIGFNNIGYDYPLLHFIIENYYFKPTYADIYIKSSSIINTPWERRFDNVVWDSDTYVQQIDLYKIHHFDNRARRTSLKMLEFNMRSDNIQELPFPPDERLTFEQVPKLIQYNDHDVDETGDFHIESIEMIEFREQLSKKYKRNYLNFSDVKIGKEYIIRELEKATPGSCYTYETGYRETRQTWHYDINIGEIIFPYIKFEQPEFKRVKQWLSQQIITETKDVFKDLIATINKFDFKFGLGGIHGSIDPTIVFSDNDYQIVDVDVKSYYPNIVIKNKLHPEHLGIEFSEIFAEIYEERKKHKKGSSMNAALKLALNGGGFGGGGDIYCPIYDIKYLLAITVNGQLLLCMLAEQLIKIPGLQLIQINTDGITIRCLHNYIKNMNEICKWWEQFTCLELENVNYNRMFIRDVNNYIAENEKGKIKRKGAYGYITPKKELNTQERGWHKNHSALVVPKAAEAALVHGQCIDDFIINHPNIMDFMLRTKINRSDKLVYDDAETNIAGKSKELQRITRYYISKTGGTLTKISSPAKGAKVGVWKRANSLTDEFYNSVIDELKNDPGDMVMIFTPNISVPVEVDSNGLPWDERINTKNRSKYEIRRTGLEVGWLVKTCNDIRDANRNNINYDYYIKETEKLVNPLRGKSP